MADNTTAIFRTECDIIGRWRPQWVIAQTMMTMAETISFGNWIRQRRRALDLTQEQVAASIGCSISAIRKIEADERRPSQQVAELLADRLQIPDPDRATFLKVARRELGFNRLETIGGAQMPTLAAPIRWRRQRTTATHATNGGPRSTPALLNLPPPPTPLVGREVEVARISEILSDPECRLLTLTGPGGHRQDAFGDRRSGEPGACGELCGRRLLCPPGSCDRTPIRFGRPWPARWACACAPPTIPRRSSPAICSPNSCSSSWTIWSICWMASPSSPMFSKRPRRAGAGHIARAVGAIGRVGLGHPRAWRSRPCAGSSTSCRRVGNAPAPSSCFCRQHDSAESGVCLAGSGLPGRRPNLPDGGRHPAGH